MALIQYSFRSEVLKENTEIYVILPTYEVFRDPEKKGAETYYKEYERKKTLYVLHGGSDDASLYLRRTRLEEYALERDLAVVMPEVRNSFYCDRKIQRNAWKTGSKCGNDSKLLSGLCDL